MINFSSTLKINPRVVMASLAFVATISMGTVIWLHVDGISGTLKGQRPFPFLSDFASSYGTALILNDFPPGEVYVPATMIEYTKRAGLAAYDYSIPRASVERTGFSPFMYPPIFILAIIPLGSLGYWSAWWAWMTVSGGLFLGAVSRVLDWKTGILLALAAPPTFFNLIFGQTGFLTAGMIGLGLALLRQRPIVSGILIGAASFKPQFGLLIPFALAAGGYWRTFLSATGTVAALVGVSVAVLGIDTWLLFFHATSVVHLSGFEQRGFSFVSMISPMGTLNLLKIPAAWAWSMQAAISLSCIWLTVRIWRHGPQTPAADGLKYGLLCSCALIATPMAYLYDTALLIPAWGWFLADCVRKPPVRLEALLVIASGAGLFAVIPVAHRTGIQAGPLLVLLTVAVFIYRIRTFPNDYVSDTPPASQAV